MKIEFDITYDAGKLQKAMPKMIREYMNGALSSLFKGSKDALKSGKFIEISDFTKFVREEGLSGHFGQRKSSTKPLRHSGQLFRSLKMSKRNKELEFNKYGMFHLGMQEGETIDLDLDEFVKRTGKGSGEAYKIKPNKWTSFIKKQYGIDVANKSVPVRDWLRFDKTINTIKKTFFDTLDKSFKKNG